MEYAHWMNRFVLLVFKKIGFCATCKTIHQKRDCYDGNIYYLFSHKFIHYSNKKDSVSPSTCTHFRPTLEIRKKRGVKPGSNIKADKIHGYWYLAYKDYQKLASQYIKTKRRSFLNSSHCAAWFTGTKSEDQYFGRFVVNFDNGKLEASAVMLGRSRIYVEIEKKLIQ